MQFPYGRGQVQTVFQASSIHELITGGAVNPNTTFTSPSRPKISSIYIDATNHIVTSDQNGNLFLEESNDNSTWTQTKLVAISGGIGPQELGYVHLSKNYYRINFQNTSTTITGNIVIYEMQNPLGTNNVQVVGSGGAFGQDASKNLMVGLNASTIVLPVDIQASSRIFQFSTTANLASGGVFTSSSIDLLSYSEFSGKVFADQAGTLAVQESDDNTTWDTTYTIPVVANTPQTYNYGINCRYARVIYTNGAVAQTVFRLSGYSSTIGDGSSLVGSKGLVQQDANKSLLVGLRASNGNEPTITGPSDGMGATTSIFSTSMLAGFNGTTWDRLRVDAQKNLLVGLRNSSGIEPTIGNIFTSSDNTGTSDQALVVASEQRLFNETSWDRQRGNTQGTVLASAARTTGTVSPTQTNYNAKGVIIHFNISVASGTGGLSVLYGYIDPVSGQIYETGLFGAAKIATGYFTAIIYPGISASNATATLNTVVPRAWRVNVTAVDATSYTYSVGYQYIL